MPELPEWNNAGTEPDQTKKDSGWEAGEKPPADFFNWFFNRTYESIKDNAEKLDEYVSVKDFGAVGDGETDDTEAIQNALDNNSVIFFPPNNEFLISSALEIGSNTTIVLNSCKITLDSDSNDNIFRNKDFAGDENIHIYGVGMPWLDGNASNQDREVYGSEGAESYKYTGIYFCNVSKLSVQNIKLGPTHAWGLCHQRCDDFIFKNIKFNQDGSTSNQDGITSGGGAKNGIIEDIYGKTGDDTVALNTHDNQDFVNPDYAGGDIENIKINNIQSKILGGHQTVRLLAGDGHIIKNIKINNITDITKEEDIVGDKTQINAVISINHSFDYGDVPANKFETMNIEVNNVSGLGNSIIRIQGTLFNAKFNNIRGGYQTQKVIDIVDIEDEDYPSGDISKDGLIFNNITIQTRADQGWENAGTLIYIGKNCDANNIIVSGIYSNTCYQLLVINPDGTKERVNRIILNQIEYLNLGSYPFVLDGSGTSSTDIFISNINRILTGSASDKVEGRIYTSDISEMLKINGENIPHLTSDDEKEPFPYEGQKMFFESDSVFGNTNPMYVIGDGTDWVTIKELT